MPTPVKSVLPVVLLGCGGVGRYLLRHIVSCRPLHANQGVAIRVVGVADSSSLLVAEDVHSNGLDDALLTQLCAAKSAGSPLSSLLAQGHCQLFKNPEARGKEDFQKLVSNFRRIRFESTVGAGLPVIASVTRIIASGDPVSRIVGSLSGTLGYVMNPRDDLGGMDVARKVSELGPDAVSTKDFLESGLVQLDKSMEERVKAAASRGNVLRYVAEIESTGCQVGLKELPKDSALGRLRGSDNVVMHPSLLFFSPFVWSSLYVTTDCSFDQVEIYSRCYQSSPLVIQGAGAGNDTTAAGVLADIIDLQDLFQTTA
ncbi:hypothetical protein SORBI_3008G019532 [Sorghum bicolor]|uniref:homoserine dehydrogenase n=1 Tax=Sorghum bicolor TaxID=4558 RepID=C5YQR0_SORBI|nr:hypothetical protein SORBI_3008G019532 [Sorghum bicolor]